MGNELLAVLLHVNLAAGGAALAVLAVRGVARQRFGAGFAYRLWTCVPVAAVAAGAGAAESVDRSPGGRRRWLRC